jgi:hypothetical protein
MSHLKNMRDQIEKSVANIRGLVINGYSDQRVVNTTNLGFVDIDAIKPICAPEAPSWAANMGRMGDLDIVELKIAKAPQKPTMIIIRSSAENFFIYLPHPFYYGQILKYALNNNIAVSHIYVKVREARDFPLIVSTSRNFLLDKA